MTSQSPAGRPGGGGSPAIRLPHVLVHEWQIHLAAPPGQPVSFSPTPAGVHAVVSRWLHSTEDDRGGEPHHAEHRYSVEWWRTSHDHLCIALALMDEHLVATLLRRVRPGLTVGFGRVAALVTKVSETRLTDLADLRGQTATRWRLSFPAGVTFKRGDTFMPWPSPEAVLGSIHRRLTAICGWQADRAGLRDALQSISPIQANLTTHRWKEGASGRPRDVALAVGDVEWLTATSSPGTQQLVDLLLQAGELLGVGAKTAWGAGVLETERLGPGNPSNRVVPR